MTKLEIIVPDKDTFINCGHSEHLTYEWPTNLSEVYVREKNVTGGVVVFCFNCYLEYQVHERVIKKVEQIKLNLFDNFKNLIEDSYF